MNKKIITGASLLAAGLIAGSFAGISGASAAEDTTANTSVTNQTTYPVDGTATVTPTVDPTTPPAPPAGAPKAHTPETPVTGDLATELSNLAKAANPGATVDRVENDTDGDTYEVHLTLADGSHVTVKFDADKNITKTETGPAFGGPNGPKGPHGHHGGDHGPRGGDHDGDGPDSNNSGTDFSTVTPLNG